MSKYIPEMRWTRLARHNNVGQSVAGFLQWNSFFISPEQASKTRKCARGTNRSGVYARWNRFPAEGSTLAAHAVEPGATERTGGVHVGRAHGDGIPKAHNRIFFWIVDATTTVIVHARRVDAVGRYFLAVTWTNKPGQRRAFDRRVSIIIGGFRLVELVVEGLFFNEGPDLDDPRTAGCIRHIREDIIVQPAGRSGWQFLLCVSIVEQREANVLHIVLTLAATRRLARRLDRRKKQGDEDSDDCDDNQQFDKCESTGSVVQPGLPKSDARPNVSNFGLRISDCGFHVEFLFRSNKTEQCLWRPASNRRSGDLYLFLR